MNDFLFIIHMSLLSIDLVTNNTQLINTRVLLVDCSSNDITITLPLLTCNGISNAIIRIDSNNLFTLTVVTSDNTLINGNTSITININTNNKFISYDNKWYSV